MVQRLSSIDTIVTDTETEALVLEANLIRQLQPPYNVLLRDDKFYLFIKVTTNENVPRVFPVRKLKSDGARYFGPYSSASSVRQTLQLLRRIFPHPTEKENLRHKTFPHPLFAPGAKSAPHSPEHNEGDGGLLFNSSQENISSIIRFLRGDRQTIINTLRQGMIKAARLQRFEQAAIFRNQLQAIERLEGSQKVFLPRRESFDVLSLARRRQHSAMNVFSFRQGKLLHKNTFLLRR
jgi:excinuclease ABC subunit C